MQWFAQAPSNIALIKYMGKDNKGNNLPINASLSYTLNNLLSSVTLESHPGTKDYWEQLNTPGGQPFALSTDAQERFLNHLQRLKEYFNYTGAFIVRSCNNFPHSSGLASSASSFAALTKCAVIALGELTNQNAPSIEEQAQLSRHGSGSSCRSFFSPWALWEKDKVEAVDLPYTDLIHQVIIVSHAEKEVPSSMAHQRVSTSSEFVNRHKRAQKNLKELISAFKDKNWPQIYKICWREFQDMHNLFTTSQPPFTYINDKCKNALNAVEQLWFDEGDGPIVTMDAGPNIHLLYRTDQNDCALKFKNKYLVGNYDIL